MRDCIDILRLLRRLDDFKIERLQFVNDYPHMQSNLWDLLKECYEFIQITEEITLKMHMERNSQNYLKDLFLIFKTLNKTESGERFPIMAKYLKNHCERILGVLDSSYEQSLKI